MFNALWVVRDYTTDNNLWNFSEATEMGSYLKFAVSTLSMGTVLQKMGQSASFPMKQMIFICFVKDWRKLTNQ